MNNTILYHNCFFRFKLHLLIYFKLIFVYAVRILYKSIEIINLIGRLQDLGILQLVQDWVSGDSSRSCENDAASQNMPCPQNYKQCHCNNSSDSLGPRATLVTYQEDFEQQTENYVRFFNLVDICNLVKKFNIEIIFSQLLTFY